MKKFKLIVYMIIALFSSILGCVVVVCCFHTSGNTGIDASCIEKKREQISHLKKISKESSPTR